MKCAKHLLIGLLLCACVSSSLAQPDFESQYKAIAAIYQEELLPYLATFAKSQYPPPAKPSKERDLLEQSLVRVFVEKGETAIRNCHDELTKLTAKDGKPMNIVSITSSLDQCIRYEFPGIDYKYFETVEKKVKARFGG